MLKNIIINARKTEPAPPVYFTELWGTGLQQYLVGDNTTINRSSPVQIGTDTDWSYVHSGPSSYAIKTSGSLWAWGSNEYGEMGDNTSGFYDHRSSPVQVGTLTNWKKIVGYNNAIALKTDGTIWVWGRNGGTLGLGDIVNRSSPVQMGTDTDWYDITDIPASLAIKTNGTLWGWGNTGNFLGLSLPANEFNEIVTANRSFSSFSSDNVHALAISQDGTLWGWGNQQSVGLLGLNGGDNFRSSAVQVGSDNNWSKISAGWNHCAGIKTDGTLWAWGRNNHGQLGLGDKILRSSPVQVGTRSDWTQVSAGRSHTMALRSDGTFWSFGGNANWVLGLSLSRTTEARSSPVQVGTRSDWTQVSAAEAHSAAIRSDGTLWTWGTNNLGRTGIGTTFSANSSPVQVGTRSDWTQVSINEANSAAIRSDGTLWTWGQNGAGQLGDGTTINRSSPVQVGTRSDWSQVSTRSSTIAVVSDGTLWVWGLNSSGQLGLLDSISRSSPTQVGTLSNWVSGSGANVVNMVMDNSGKIYTAGLFQLNQIGVLGRSPADNTQRSSPVQIGTETNWAKFFHNCIQKTDSTVWTLRSKPTQVEGSTDWKILAVDNNNAAKIGIKNDGTLWSWGGGPYGILGQNTSSAVGFSFPTQIGTDNNWHYISRIGNGSIQAIKTNGTLWGWGQPYTFGPGDLIERSSPTQVGTLSNWVSASNGYLIGHFIKRYT